MTCPETCPWSSQTEESRLDCHEAMHRSTNCKSSEANALRGNLEEVGVRTVSNVEAGAFALFRHAVCPLDRTQELLLVVARGPSRCGAGGDSAPLHNQRPGAGIRPNRFVAPPQGARLCAPIVSTACEAWRKC